MSNDCVPKWFDSICNWWRTANSKVSLHNDYTNDWWMITFPHINFVVIDGKIGQTHIYKDENNHSLKTVHSPNVRN